MFSKTTIQWQRHAILRLSGALQFHKLEEAITHQVSVEVALLDIGFTLFPWFAFEHDQTVFKQLLDVIQTSSRQSQLQNDNFF